MDGQLLEEWPMMYDVLCFFFLFFCGFLEVLASLPKMQKPSRKPKNTKNKTSDTMDGQLLEEWPMVSDVLLFFRVFSRFWQSSGFLKVLAIFPRVQKVKSNLV